MSNLPHVEEGSRGKWDWLTITNGGSLACSGADDWNSIGMNNTGLMVVENGGSASFGNHLWIGFDPTADGTLSMNDGTESVGQMFRLGWNGGTVTVHVNGGTLNLLQWDGANSIKGASVLDFGLGTVVITGNQVSSVGIFISSGKITGYGGTGIVSNFFDGVSTTDGSVPGGNVPALF
ncbi:MAG TPA: hypothetical protein VNT26_14075 [Candidatus Sulfotelmatobacter sp.]|nr:hypothetical protein [Candidatus Sulfotelmatobacter sp.]